MDQPHIQYATASDGVRIAYARYPGESPVFLKINTPGAPSLSLRLTLPAYGDAFRQFLQGRAGVYFDWRGSGDSDAVAAPISVADLVADIDAVTAAIGEPVDAQFVGTACFAGILHAVQHPDRYRSIWILGGSVREGENWQGLFNRPGWERNYGEHLLGLVRGYFDVPPAEARRSAALWARGVSQEAFAAYREAERGLDLTAALPEVRVPVWVAANQSMDFAPASVLASFLPDAEVSSLDLTTGGPEHADYERAEWDRHLGARLGDPPSNPAMVATTAAPAAGADCPPNPPDGLTPREIEVLRLVAATASNPQIAASLEIAVGTVRRHISNILHKTGLENRRQLMRYADEHYPPPRDT